LGWHPNLTFLLAEYKIPQKIKKEIKRIQEQERFTKVMVIGLPENKDGWYDGVGVTDKTELLWNDPVDGGWNDDVFLGRWVDVRVGWNVSAIPKKEGG